MGKLLEQAASPEAIHDAWKRFRNDRTVWRPSLPVSEAKRNIGLHLMRLAEELRTGTYIPDPVRIFPVQKGDGGQRLISACTLRDKVAQRAVLGAATPFAERFYHPDSYGYRPGRSVEMAVNKVREYVRCGFEWLVDADIKSCFDEIPHKPLIREVKKLIPDRDVVDLIQRWMDAGAIRRGVMVPSRGTPQGSVLSPFLANVYLTRWDQDMAANNLPFVRFADDFLVFTKTGKDAHKALCLVEKSLKRIGLRLNAEKTRVARSGPGVRFLGKRLPRPEKRT